MKAIIHFFKGKKQIMAQIQFCSDAWEPKKIYGYRIEKGWKRQIKMKDEYIICPAAIADDFLQINGVNTYEGKTTAEIKNGYCWNTKYTNPDPLTWYSFTCLNGKEYQCMNLKTAHRFLEKWAEHEYPVLYKNSTNSADLAINTFMGSANATFYTRLVDTEALSVILDEDITQKEIDALQTAVFMGNKIEKALYALESVRKMTPDEVTALEEHVSGLETEWQNVIDRHKEEIVAREKEEMAHNEPFPFSCGEIRFYPALGSELEDQVAMLLAARKRHFPYLNISIPMCNQSVDIQAAGAKLARELIEEECDQSIRFESQLD